MISWQKKEAASTFETASFFFFSCSYFLSFTRFFVTRGRVNRTKKHNIVDLQSYFIRYQQHFIARKDAITDKN